MDTSIIVEIERRIATLDRRHGLCLHYTKQTLAVLHEQGLRAVLQAGSLQWPLVRPEDDDGVSSTHFAYMWSPTTPQSNLAVAMGNLPEMHCWVGLLDTQEIVDFSVRHLKEAARHHGLKWTAADPPQYLWTRELPDWVK